MRSVLFSRKLREKFRGWKDSWMSWEKYRVLLDLKNTESEKDKQQIKDLQNKEAELNVLLENKNQLLTVAEKTNC